MQIVCGQCGAMLDVEPHPMMVSVSCSECGHPVSLVGFSQAADAIAPAEGELFDDATGFAVLAQRTLREKVVIVCGSCGVRLRVARRFIGQDIACPACAAEITVPSPAEDDFHISMREGLALTDAIDVGEEHQGKSTKRPAGDTLRLSGWVKQHRQVLLAGGLAAALMAVLVVAALLGGGEGGTLQTPGATDRPVASTPPVAASDPPVRTPGQPHRSLRPTAPQGPALSADLASWRMFAAGLRYPARSDRLFLVLTIAPPQPDTPPVVHLAGQQYPALGRPASPGPVPVPAVSSEAHPGRSWTQRVFELPVRGGLARLPALPDGRTTARLPVPPQPPALKPGVYVEQSPRNLRPLLRGPILQAVQTAPSPQTLRLSRQGGQLRIELPAAGLDGRLRPVRTGLAEGLLRKAEHTRVVKLRSCPPLGERAGQSLVVLYLDPEPMHQLTFRYLAPAKGE